MVVAGRVYERVPCECFLALGTLVELLLTTWSLHVALGVFWSLGALEEPYKAQWCFLALGALVEVLLTTWSLHMALCFLVPWSPRRTL